MGWIGVIIVGIIIGLLGKFAAPGSHDDTPLWLTVVCGVVGVLVGWAIIGEGHTLLRWTGALLVAAILVVFVSSVEGRNTNKV